MMELQYFRKRARKPLLLILSILCVMAGCRDKPEKEEVIRPVRAMKTGAIKPFDDRRFSGRAKATEEVNLAFEVSGRLIERPVNVGDPVKTRELLAKLDPRDFENNLQAAKADRLQASALRDRIAEALKTGAVAEQDLTDAQAKLDIAESKVKIAKKALEDSVVKAPFDGKIAAIYVENFENITAKQIIMRLLDTSKIEMIVDIPESMISDAKHVRDVKISFDAIGDRTFDGQVKEISNEASATTRTYPVTLIMEQPEDVEILPGMAGQAWGRLDKPDDDKAGGFVIPVSSILYPYSGQDTFVWVIDKNTKTLSLREVTLGRLTDLGYIVNKGLEEGEWIAVAGVSFLRQGQKVVILPSEKLPTGQRVTLPVGLGATAGQRTVTRSGGRK